MTEKAFISKVLNLGGVIDDPGLAVSFPGKLCIKTKAQALDLIDILICDFPEGGNYMIDTERPHRLLRAFIKGGNVC